VSVRAVLSAALRFRMLVVALAAGLLVVGVFSLRQMHNDVIPELASGPVLEVQTEALGLSSQEVEQYVTVPLENNLLDGVMGVWDVRSSSIPGLSAVDLYFEPGVTLLHARQLVQERLTNAFSLPNVSRPPVLIQPLSSSSRAMMIGLSSSTLSPLALSYLARWVVKPRLAGVPGVANVAIFGQRDRQIQVVVDPARLARNGVTLSQIIQTAGNAQLVSPLTYLEGSSPGTGGFLDGANQRLEIRPVLPLGAPRDLARVPISDAPGKLALGSVARVILGNQPLIGDALTQASPGLVLLVQKLPSASLQGVTKGLERALNDLRPGLAGVSVDTGLFRPATYEASALSNLSLAAAIALVLGALALLALLWHARAAAIALVSVALSLLTAALVLDLLGYTLNALVVLGLLLALAVVVDDAIGATEAMLGRLRNRASGAGADSLGQSLVEASAPLRSTFAYATLIVLLFLAPAFLSKGLAARFVHPMLLALALAVIASMLVGLTVTPALGVLLLGRGRPPRRPAPTAWLRSGYERALRGAMAIPRAAIIATCVLGLAGIAVLPFLHEPQAPTFQDRSVVVGWSGPAGASLAEMSRITRRTAAALRALPGVADVGATLGRAVTADRIVDSASGEMFVTIRSGADYDRVLASVRATVLAVPGISAQIGTYEANALNGVLAPARPGVSVRIYGEDLGELRLLSARVSALLSRTDGLGAARVQPPVQEPNIEVIVDDGAALRAGVLPGEARRQASTLISGLTVGNFFQNQAVFDVVVRGENPAQPSVASVRDLLIDTSGGGHVRLGAIARVNVRPDPVDIQHEALSRYLDVTAPVYSGSPQSAATSIQKGLDTVVFPSGYHAEVIGATPEAPTSHAAFMSYLLAAAVGIVLLLQAAFGSWRLAVAFFCTLPLCLAGALIVAVGSGQASTLGADAGLLAVLIFAVRQGMPMVTAVRRQQRGGDRALRAEMVRSAAADRFAPALGSAVVLAAALIPFVVLGNVPGNELTHVSAAVMMGGLVSTTLLNLLVLPVICVALGPPGQLAPEPAFEDVMPEPAFVPIGPPVSSGAHLDA
jgi:Cu/Ag efflux pump CusA